MADSEQLIDVFDARARRREDRRAFFTKAAGAVAIGMGGFAYASQAAAQSSTPSDADILNFALNLEYLEANFYLFATTGNGLDTSLTTGSTSQGAQGAATGGTKVPFSDPVVAAYANEIAQDELSHVKFLRNALGTTAAVAQPKIDVSAAGAFTSAAIAAGIITQGQTFDPYANDVNFLLGAFIFEDVGVTAYKGAAPLLTNKTYLDAAAGILAVEAYHAAIVRTTLYGKGISTGSPTAPAVPDIFTNARKISDLRDGADGTTTSQVAENTTIGTSPDDDQGIDTVVVNGQPTSNVAPLNINGLAYSRNAQRVLNVVYLTPSAATMGGFFPNGVNGAIRASLG